MRFHKDITVGKIKIKSKSLVYTWDNNCRQTIKEKVMKIRKSVLLFAITPPRGVDIVFLSEKCTIVSTTCVAIKSHLPLIYAQNALSSRFIWVYMHIVSVEF